MSKSYFAEFKCKMLRRRSSAAAIGAFERTYRSLVSGSTGEIPENDIQRVTRLKSWSEIQKRPPDPSLFSKTVVLKLNGGLGTGMGLQTAKSLLPVKGSLRFLDFIVRQILNQRLAHGSGLRFVLMNSRATHRDTLRFLRAAYPEMGDPGKMELMQNEVPKVNAATLRPAVWRKDPGLEWCPPGHGDSYTSLQATGWLDRLLDDGMKYLFVSNADNLGAVLDPHLLTWFARCNLPFLMEVCERTDADRKGGHLARKAGRYVLRETAQCPEADRKSFRDIRRHRFFNTNNLWIRLDHLKTLLTRHGGFLPLPFIQNKKHLDPRDPASPEIFQLETAMGSAIELFEGATAIVVPRNRFAPVKTTNDLLAVRSDAYQVTPDWRLVLAPECGGRPPVIALDEPYYKNADQLDALLAGVPSLKHCTRLEVRGPVEFRTGNIFWGQVEITGKLPPKLLRSGIYRDVSLTL